MRSWPLASSESCQDQLISLLFASQDSTTESRGHTEKRRPKFWCSLCLYDSVLQAEVLMTRRFSIAPLVLAFFLTMGAAAQELSTAKPEAVGLSSERLERIGSAVQRDIADKRIAGA